MRALIIHNLDAGFGSNSIFSFQRELLSYGDECVMRVLDSGAPAAEVLTDVDDFDLVVISGGDGTVSSSLYALRDSGIPTCVFPSGTGNLFFANLGNGNEPMVIAKACRDHQTAPVDLGELRLADENGDTMTRGFAIMAGMGFDGQIMKTATDTKKSLGEAAYVAAAFSNLNPTVSNFTITVDGEKHELTGISCIVANAATIQGDINILPGCRMDDSQLDVMVLATTDAVGLLIPLFAGIIDPLGSFMGRPRIERFTGKTIRVESSVALPFQCDGDPQEGLCQSFEATCLPKSNIVVVDKNSPYFQK